MFRSALLLLCLIAVFSPANVAFSATSGIPLGSAPGDIAIDPGTNIAVVTTQSGVSIVDLAAQSVISTLPVYGAQKVAIDPGLDLALVTGVDNSVSTIDLGSPSVVSKTAFNQPLSGIAVNPANHTAILLSAGPASSYALIWDIQTQAIIASVPIKGAGQAVAIDPGLGGTEPLAVVVGQKFITVMDLTSNQVTEQFTSGVNQTAISINPETHLAAIADKGTDTLTVLNLLDWQSFSVSVPKHPVYVAANRLDNQALVISVPAQSSGSVIMSLVDLSSDSITGSYTINSLPAGVAVNNFTNIAGVIDDDTNSLSLIQLPNPVPAVSSVNPATLFRGGANQAISVSGSGFIEASAALIQSASGSYTVTPIFTDNHNISLPVPVDALADTDTLQVTISNPAPGGGQSSASSVSVVNPVPTISSLVPLDVMAGTQSQELDVYGTGFFGNTSFFINGTLWPSYYGSYLKTRLELSAGDMAYGRYMDIGAFNPLPGGGYSKTMRFTVLNPVPALNALAPNYTFYSTPAALVINGAGFVPTSQVLFNGSSLPFTYTGWNTLGVNIPARLVSSAGNYGVEVINPAPGGGASNVIDLAVMPRPITVKADDKTITYGGPAPAFSYSITSGSFINGDSLGTPVYTFNGSTTVPVAAGTYAVAVAGLSNPNYAITVATGTFTINPRQVTVTADPQSKVYGDADPALTYKITSGSLVGSDVFSGALARVPGEDVGVYAIQQGTLSLGSNYALTYIGANLTINKANALCTVAGYNVTYDGNAHTASGSCTGVFGENLIGLDLGGTMQTNPGTYSSDAWVFTDITGNYNNTSGTVIDVINQMNPALSLALQTGSPEPSPYGTQMYFELSTASTVACPTGSVSFFIDGSSQPAETITLNSTTRPDCSVPVEFQTAGLTVGTHSVTAVYSGDTYYRGATSNAVPHTVVADGTAVTLAASGTTVNVGDTITFTATVTPAPVNGSFSQPPAGSVQFDEVDGQGNIIATLGSNPLSGTTATFSASTLPAGTYNVWAVFVDSDGGFQGSSSPIALETVELRVPVITWTPNISTITYGTPLGADQLDATASDPETRAPVAGTFSYVPAAGSVQGAGNPNLQATFTPADGNTYSTNSASTTITVTPAVLTVTADSQTMTYGGAVPNLTFQYSGFINGEAPSVVVTAPVCNTTATSSSNAGNYSITCSGGVAPNYSFKYVNGTLTISPLPLTVTADPQTKIYGGADPALTYKITKGSLIGNDASTGTLTRVPGESAGTYAILQGTLALTSNYALTYVGANLVIAQKLASVTPNPASKLYGQPDPVFTGTLSGFLASDNITAVYTRTAGENAGTYAISAVLSPASVLTNYSITYNTALFTINNPVPVLGSLTPATISPNTAAIVIINGTGFVPTSAAFLNGTGIAASCTDGGHLSVTVPASLAVAGSYNITVTNPAPGGGTSNPLVLAVKSPLPPDPATVAPQLDTTVSTTMLASTSFLYSGANPIQNGVSPGTIQASFAAVIRGKVMDVNGNPLGGANITILGHPEFGGTQSRADGAFDMAVNGGDVLTVKYYKPGYLSVQRQVNVPWQDYAHAPDVVMIQQDSAANPVNLASTAPIQVARANSVTDTSGTRQATLLFNQGTSATMVMPDGSTSPITNMTVRATEFTAGANGPAAMPGPLAPNVGYTYAVDFSADEEVAGGAEIYFSQPVISYTENFLNMYVGQAVPVGSYDPNKGEWVPSTNGRVIAILSNANGIASIDVDGNGSSATSTELSNLGVTTAELQQLASMYQPGQSFWRVPIPHFSQRAYDVNWAYQCNSKYPADCTPPNNVGIINAVNNVQHPNECKGCIIEAQNQTLGENVNIDGTPFSLDYRSSLQPGRTDDSSLNISLTGTNVPTGLLGIDLQIDIAGQTFAQSFTPAANLSYSFNWNGLDVYGRPVQGSQPVTVSICYDYPGIYSQLTVAGGDVGAPVLGNYDRIFGHWTYFGLPASGDLARGSFTICQQMQSTTSSLSTTGHWSAQGQGFGGWTLSVQHAYDPVGRVLYMGDGSRRTVNGMNSIITTIAGGQSGNLKNPSGVASDSMGNIYMADTGHNVIKEIDTGGNISIIAGNGSAGFSGDGGAATAASLDNPTGVAVDSSGNIYIADTLNNRIRMINPGGMINTVAGNGQASYSGDGGPATQATLYDPSGVAVDSSGNIYIADSGNNRIRMIDPRGEIVSVAGNGQTGYSGDGGPAQQYSLNMPTGVAVDRFGNIYIADRGNNRVRKVNPGGVISTVAGNGLRCYSNGCSIGDGGPALQAYLDGPASVAVDGSGNVFIADMYYSRIRRIDPSGIITTYAGNGLPEYTGDNGVASSAGLNFPAGVAVDPAGDIYIADTNNNAVRRITASFPGVSTQNIVIPSEDGSEIYIFDPVGKHLQTLDALTGVTIYSFGYDSSNRLITVTDRDGNITTINRDGAGNPVSITASGGQVTTFSLDSHGYLAGVADPGGNRYSFSYKPDGLMTTETDPRGNTHSYTYDPKGRLVYEQDPAGGSKTFSQVGIPTGYTVSLTTGMGLTSTFEVQTDPFGNTISTDVDPAGLKTVSTEDNFGTGTTTYPNGTVVNKVMGPDPRFGMQAPVTSSMDETTPGGLQYSLSETRTANFAKPGDVFSFTSLTDSVNVNGDVFTSIYNPSTMTITDTTPTGRQSFRTLDSKGHVITSQTAGLLAINFGYDTLGRLTSTTQGTGSSTRLYSYNYDSQNRIQSIIDPMQRSVSFGYDQAGRVNQETLPDGRIIGFGHDSNGNLSSLSPPGKPAHSFDYTPVDLTADYIPPALGFNGTTAYQYDLDRRPTEVDSPTGSNLAPLSDNTENTAFTYDGSLLTSAMWTGVINGSVGFSYNNNFDVASEIVNGAAIGFSYDKDGLLTGAGSLVINRDPNNGLITGSTLGNVADSWSYNGFGEPSSYTASFGRAPLFSIQYVRDNLGRITKKTETIGGIATVYSYGYDLAGRLIDVFMNGILTSHYDYDSNGNRADAVISGAVINGTYDAQDRVVTYGQNIYAYTNNGSLANVVGPSGITQYGYDNFGNLQSVILPNGTQIDYVIDGQNRRIGKKVNGLLVQGFLYENQLRPIAELDANGNIVSQFVYGTKVNIPDYMIKNGNTYRIVTDHLGSPRLIVDVNTGQVIQQINYDEFGNVTYDSNPGFQPFGFAGGLYDRDTGLVRFGARDYDAQTGRWTAKDPIGFGGGDSNLFSYGSENDPINYIDSLGLWTYSLGVTVNGGAGVGGGGGTFFNVGHNPNGGWLSGWSFSVTGVAGGGAVAGAGYGVGISTTITNACDTKQLLGGFTEAGRGGLGRGGVTYIQSPDGTVQGVNASFTLSGKGYTGAAVGTSNTSAIVQWSQGQGLSFGVTPDGATN